MSITWHAKGKERTEEKKQVPGGWFGPKGIPMPSHQLWGGGTTTMSWKNPKSVQIGRDSYSPTYFLYFLGKKCSVQSEENVSFADPHWTYEGPDIDAIPEGVRGDSNAQGPPCEPKDLSLFQKTTTGTRRMGYSEVVALGKSKHRLQHCLFSLDWRSFQHSEKNV